MSRKTKKQLEAELAEARRNLVMARRIGKEYSDALTGEAALRNKAESGLRRLTGEHECLFAALAKLTDELTAAENAARRGGRPMSHMLGEINLTALRKWAAKDPKPVNIKRAGRVAQLNFQSRCRPYVVLFDDDCCQDAGPFYRLETLADVERAWELAHPKKYEVKP